MRLSALSLLPVTCLLIAFPPLLQAGDVTPRVKDFDAEYFEGAKANLLRGRKEVEHARSSMIPRLVERNAREAIPVLVALLEDSEEEVRRTAAQYLAMLRDRRGLAVQLTCAADPNCERYHPVALRLLGSSDLLEFAGPIAREIRDAYQRYQKDGPLATTKDREYLRNGVVALARLGRSEDRDLILTVIGGTYEDLALRRDLLEALGYVNDPRANQILWNAYETMLKPQKSFYDAFPGAIRDPSCSEEHLGVRALLPLSRLGDSLAIERLRQIIRGIGTPADTRGSERSYPTLCEDRQLAIGSLKPRDAKNFAETAFEVAAQEPEGPGTREAWDALGIMHPKGFGDRLFRLAMRKKPHWKLVSRQALHDAIMASDPSLNEAFWRGYGVEVIPAHRGQRVLVEMGLGRLMYSGASYWMFWTGD